MSTVMDRGTLPGVSGPGPGSGLGANARPDVGPTPHARAPGIGGAVKGQGLSTFLGWFSIGLGLAEIAAPRELARLIGIEPTDRTVHTLRGLGLREIATGVGILSNPQQPGWLWGRVAGDAMDLSLLGRSMGEKGAERDRTTAATAAVLGVTALDVVAAQRLSGGATEGIQREADDDGSLPEPKGRHAVKSITVQCSPEQAYAFWHDFENLPRFMRHLESVQVLGGGRSRWRARAPAGASVEWEAETIADEPNRRIAWRSVPGSDVSNSGEVLFTPAPGDRGTEIRVEIRYDPPAGPLGVLFAKLFREAPDQQVQDDLRAFKQMMELGEVVVSDATVRRGPHPGQPPAPGELR